MGENQKDRHSSCAIFTTIVLVALFCGLDLLMVWRRQDIPSQEDEKKAQRLKVLAELNAEDSETLTKYHWIDRDKGIVGIPMARAMDLVLAELRSNRPHAADPLVVESKREIPHLGNPSNNQPEADQAGGVRAPEPGDSKVGKIIFLQCAACHSVEPGVNKVGPTLAGIFGRKAGTVEDFNYSDANKNSGIIWNEDTLRDYLPDPQKLVPGTKMAFPGLKDPEQVEDVIAYLKDATK